MKKTAQISAITLLIFASSCGPKNEEVTDEQIETGPPQEVLDSIANAEKDALRTDENDSAETLQMPLQIDSINTPQ